MGRSPNVRWTREHSLVALNLYCKLPFGSFDQSNAIIREVAAKMGRTPSSLAMKLGNLASLDPVQRARGIKGLQGASKQDKEMWQEFQLRMATLGPRSEQLLHDLFTHDEAREVDFLNRDRVRLEPGLRLRSTDRPTVREATVRVRRGQHFFRQSILNAYGVRCCISGINVPRLLVASHIKPWGKFPSERLNPQNGLCLSCLHDAAFDSGLITVDKDYRVVLSMRLKGYFPQSSLEQNFVPYAGVPIRLPDKLAEPNAEFLAFHRETVFAR